MSKSCEDALCRVYLFLDGEINWYRRLRISRHLKACPPCSSAFHFEERLRVVVRQNHQEEIPPEFLERLRAVLRDERA
jgi:anti-sigma factor (TIGR02949 family)